MKKLFLSIIPLLILWLWLCSSIVFAATPTTVSELVEVLEEEKKEVAYDIKLNAPFSKETSGILESINPETGEVIVRNSIFSIPGRNGKDLNLELVYRSRDAKLYDEGTKSANISNNYGQVIIAIYDVYDSNGYWLRTGGLNYPTTETTILSETTIDSEKWVFTGYLQYENGTSIINSGSIANTTKEKGYSSASKYIFGEGWSLDIPTLDMDEEENIYVTLLNGQTYKADFTPGVGLKEYPLGDITFTKDTSKAVGKETSAYRLYYTDGNSYYYTTSGELILEADRFNNTITYQWDNIGNKRLIVKIIDTVGRAVDIQYNDSVTVFTSGKKTVSLVKSPVPGASGKFYLSSFIDPAGRKTYYSYAFQHANFDLVGKVAAQNTYVTLKEIYYPTGLKTIYNFTGGTKNFGITGSMDYFKVSERYDLNDGNKNNRQIYKYFNEPDGYPKYKDSVIDENYKYLTELTDSKGLITKYKYNSKHQLYLKQQVKDSLLFESRIKYNDISNLPERYDNKTFNLSGDYITKTDLYKYDLRGNLIEENHPESQEDLSSDERKIYYSYSYAYNLLTSKSYKQDKDTNIEIKYQLSENGKSVKSRSLYANESKVADKKYTYDNTGNLISVSQEKDQGEWFVTRLEYDVKYNNAYLTAIIYEDVKDAEGNFKDIKIKNDYDLATGNKISTSDGNSNTTSYEYDALNRIRKEILPDGLSRSYSYDDVNNQLISKDANGNSLTYYYDSMGKLTKVVEPTQNTQLAGFQYDDEGILISSSDGNKNIKLYSYGTLNRITSVTELDSRGTILKKEDVSYDNAYRDRFGNSYLKITVREKGDTEDRIIHYYYNKFNRLSMLGRVIGGNEEIAFYHYNYLKDLLELTDFAGNKTVNVYDPLGRLTKSINAEGKEKKYTYDGLGNLSSQTDEIGITTFTEYDELGRMVVEKTPFEDYDYSEVKNYYDNVGNLTQTIDSEGYITKNYYNNRNLLNGVEQVINSSKSNIIKISYDGEGNTKSILKGLNSWNDTEYSTQAFEYDALYRLTALTDASNRKTVYEYDNNGNLIEKTDRNDVTTVFKYDGLNRLVHKENSKEGSKTAVNITYGLLGERQEISDVSGKTLFEYDVLGRISYTNYQNGIKKYYEYDSSDRVSNFKVMQGGLESINLDYEYDKIGRLTCVNEGGKRCTYQYDTSGRLLEEENKVTGLRSIYTYYPSGKLKNLSNYTVGVLNSSFNYKYDKRGNEIEKDETGTLTMYQYDPLGRLKTVELPEDTFQNYEYDDLSNRTKLIEIDGKYIKENIYTYDKDNRLLFSETTAGEDLIEQRFEYDPEGNLQKSIETIKYSGNLMVEEEFNYQYDGYNQLALVQNPDDMIYEYTYDWQGLRTKKVIGEEVINYINEDGNSILETNKDMQITARNIRGNNLIYRETDIIGLDSTYLGYIHNGHSDIIGLTDEMGNVIKKYDYDPFGSEDVNHSEGYDNRTTQILMNEVEEFDNPFRYCGEYYDEETGNIYLRARYYDPEVGRFTQEDTYLGDGYNLYTYVHNNPIKYLDPSGHKAEVSNGSWYNPTTGNIVDVHGNTTPVETNPKGISSSSNTQKTTGNNVDDDEYDDQYDDEYDRNEQNKGRGSDAKKKEKKQVDDALGKRGTKEREEKSKDLHDSKEGDRNDNNKDWEDLKTGNYWAQPEKSNSLLEKAAGVGLIIVGGGTTAFLILDDATGIGTLDDPLIAGTGGIVAKGLEMLLH